jgi:hypothetical protein
MKGWKTIAFNVLTGILLILTTQGADVWGLSTEVVSFSVVIGNFVLRFLTTTAVGSKG